MTRSPRESQPSEQIDRRSLLIGAAATAAGLAAWPWLRGFVQGSASVFIARNQTYDGPLVQTISDGLDAVSFDFTKVRGKSVLLKPNLVEPTRGCPQMTTNPAVVLAAADVFRRHGAKVIVGEGPGHMRDTEQALIASGMDDALDVGELEFADLNYGDVAWVNNVGRRTNLKGLYFSRQVLTADLIVSMPKMKTHHWVGYTGALKNLFGVMPGMQYGWPKNVLHHAGIPECIYDINAALPKTIAIVDGILAMEGDGPIMGTAKPMGLILVGNNSTAVDATLGRIMGIDPRRVNYMNLAGGRLGPIAERAITQRGERWQSVASPFKVLDQPHLRQLQPQGELIS